MHVSGTTNGTLGAGTRALDKSAFNLMTTAINSAEAGPTITNTFYNNEAVTIPDHNSAWTARYIYVSGLPSRITAANLSLTIYHPYKKDLQVMLTSPAGRNVVVHNRTGGSADNVIFNNLNVLKSFRGANPNGWWKIQVRDLARADVGTFNFGSLTLSAHN